MLARYVPLFLAAFVSAGAVALAMLLGNDLVEQAHLAARWTARVGFPIFILTYSASALARLWPNVATKSLLRHRRQWGLGFALSHTVHLAALTSFLLVSGEPPQLATVVGGGGAYLLLYAMALTSSDAAMRALGVWWKRLHRAGIHSLWFIFTFSYFGRLFEPGRMAQGLVLFPICLLALGLRLWVRAKVRRTLVSV